MKIGIDMDDVLADLATPWINYARYFHAPSITKAEYWKHPAVCRGGAAFRFLFFHNTFTNLDVLPEAVRVTDRWMEKHELFVVTAALPETYAEKARWLRWYFPHIPERNWIVTARKGLLDLDILIDDKPSNFEGFKGRAILFNQPWNVSDTKYERAYDWNHLEDLILPAVFRGCVGGVCGWEAELAVQSTIAIAEDFANRKEL